jgi:colanic acid/amylovoran biosynthesis glycosyltransferase
MKTAHVNYFYKKSLEINPAIIHSHFLTDAAFFHPFTKKINSPKICSCYGYDVSRFPKKFRLLAKFYFKKIFREYHLFLAMSEDMKNDLMQLGCPQSKIIIHYYGTNTRDFDINRTYINDDGFNILTIGSLVPKKGHITVLEAIKKIRESNPEIKIKYIIGGDGPLKNELIRFVHLNGLDEIVDFRGIVKHGIEFNKLLHDADVFVHPSVMAKDGDKEGIPGTIVEAMAGGLPVISTFHAGIPSVIQNNVNGLLVNEHDPEAIKEKLLFLYRNMDKRKCIGENAKAYAKEQLDIFVKSKELENIYHSLLNKNPIRMDIKEQSLYVS